jgi:hypothetical protein
VHRVISPNFLLMEVLTLPSRCLDQVPQLHDSGSFGPVLKIF